MKINTEDKDFLFIGGCPRSGTTALAKLIGHHPDAAIFIERYKSSTKPCCIQKYTPGSFEKALNFLEKGKSSNYKHSEKFEDYYEMIRGKINSCRIIGDKVPLMFEVYEEMAQQFPSAIFAHTVRNPLCVAASWNKRARNPEDPWPEHNDYTRAVIKWNESNRRIIEAIDNHVTRFFAISYERLFSHNEECLSSVSRCLGLPLTPSWKEYYAKLTFGWQERESERTGLTREETEYVFRHIDLDAWQEVKYLINA